MGCFQSTTVKPQMSLVASSSSIDISGKVISDDPYCIYGVVNENCQYLVKLVDILKHHHEWLISQAAGSINAESICLYISELNNYNLNGLLVLIKIYHHLQNKHNDEFEEIYNYLCNNAFECDLNNCQGITRNFRDRSQLNNADNVEKERLKLYGNNSDYNQVIIQQILDQIHCYFYHTFDVGFKLTNQEKQEINISDNDDKQSDIDVDVYEMQTKRKKITNIMYKKKIESQNVRGFSRLTNSSKFVSHIANNEEKKQENKAKKTAFVYSFGVKYYYKDKFCDNLHYDVTHNVGYTYNDWYVKKKYGNLKEELFNNIKATISYKQLKDLLTKAKIYLTSADVREYTNNIHTNGLIVMMIYCNFDKFQNEYTKTYRFINVSETCGQIKQRHVEFAHFGETLQQTVELNGVRIEDSKIKRFYHGINSEMLFTSTLNRFNGPTSTSSSFEVALSFADTVGLILELNDGTLLSDECDSMYFNCELVSDYGNEQEKFFMGGSNPLKIVSIYNVPLKESYQNFIKLVNILLSVLKGDISITNKKNYLNKKNEKGVVKLLKHELNERIIKKLPQYNHNLLHNICINIKYIFIRYNETFGLKSKNNDNQYTKYKILRDYLCCPDIEFFELNKITLLFPNLLSISIESSNLTQNVFSNILTFFEENKNNKNDGNNKNLMLNNIIFRLPTKQWMSSSKIIKEYLPKFKKYEWVVNHAKSNKKVIMISHQKRGNHDHQESIGLAIANNVSVHAETFVFSKSDTFGI